MLIKQAFYERIVEVLALDLVKEAEKEQSVMQAAGELLKAIRDWAKRHPVLATIPPAMLAGYYLPAIKRWLIRKQLEQSSPVYAMDMYSR